MTNSGKLSRRKFLASTAGVALTSNLAAPAILAQTRTPIRLGNINTYTGGLAYAGETNFNAA